MLIVTTTLTRPSVDVPFYDSGADWRAHVRSTYVSTGKLAEPFAEADKVRSADGLSMTMTSRWRSVADNVDYLVDPNADAMKAARDAYSAEHGIEIAINRQVVYDEFDLEADQNPA